MTFERLLLDVCEAVLPWIVGTVLFATTYLMYLGRIAENYLGVAFVAIGCLLWVGVEFAEMKGERIAEKYEAGEYEE